MTKFIAAAVVALTCSSAAQAASKIPQSSPFELAYGAAVLIVHENRCDAETPKKAKLGNAILWAAAKRKPSDKDFRQAAQKIKSQIDDLGIDGWCKFVETFFEENNLTD